MTALAPPPALAPWHILIIDDSPDDRAEMRQMLLRSSERRCRFTEAELGEAGLRAFRAMSAHPPDCILLDYNLPDMNAQQVLAELCVGADLTPSPTGANFSLVARASRLRVKGASPPRVLQGFAPCIEERGQSAVTYLREWSRKCRYAAKAKSSVCRGDLPCDESWESP